MALPDLGSPSSWRAASPGLPVHASGGERAGTLRHVLAVDDEDILEGLIVDSSLGDGGARFVDEADVDEFFDRGVLLRLDAAACAALHRPTAEPAAIQAHGDEPPPARLHAKLQRAWDVLSGNG